LKNFRLLASYNNNTMQQHRLKF